MAKTSQQETASTAPKASHKCFNNTLYLGIFVIVLIAVAVLLFTPNKLTPVIEISDGLIQGSIGYSRDGSEFWQFLAIPYAKPPVNSKKFTPPEPIEPWESTLQVTSYPEECAQFDTITSIRTKGQLDCLFLNVFTRAAGENILSSKPVLVWIHGGGFISGGAHFYHPEYIMDHDVVLVVMNYRLGPFGFLNLEDAENGPQGNMGLLDQNMALKWVQKNIASFGGDPKRVTIFGESAGGVSTHLQVLSKVSNGLFQRAIMMSGNALAPWSFVKQPRKLAENVAEKLHFNGKSSSEIMKCFELDDWSKIVIYQQCFLDPVGLVDGFRPSVDGKFLDATPEETLKNGEFPNIPVMFGVNGAEGSFRSARFETMPDLIEVADKNWTDVVGQILMFETPFSAEMGLKIREKYFGDLRFTENPDAFKRNLTVLFSDIGFFYGAHKSAIHHANKGAPVYMYYFNYTSAVYPGVYGVFKAIQQGGWLPSEVTTVFSVLVDMASELLFGGKGTRPYGVAHVEDLYQLWNFLGISKLVSGPDSGFSRGFVKAIIDFANDTVPLTYRDTAWSTINQDLDSGKTIRYMLMDNEEESKLIPEPFYERMKFWDDLLLEHS